MEVIDTYGRRILIGRNFINIRLATIDDIQQLVNLRILQQHDDWGSEYVDYDGKFYTRTLNALKDFLYREDDLQPSKGVIFIAEMHGKIIATCGLQRIDMLPQCNDNGQYGYVFNVFTVKEYRRQGIQSRLIENILSYSEKYGLTEIKLETDSQDAISLYKKYGFEYDTLFMSKKILASSGYGECATAMITESREV